MPLTVIQQTGLKNIVPFVRPVPVPPNANGLLPRLPSAGTLGIVGGSLAVIEVVGQLGGYKWRDDQLAKIGGGAIARKVPSDSTVTGGNNTGVQYWVEVAVTRKDTGEVIKSFNAGGGAPTTSPNGLSSAGAITGVSWAYTGLTEWRIESNGIPSQNLNGYLFFEASSVVLSRILRVDGTPETDPNPPEQRLPPVPFGLTPTDSPFKNDQDRKVGTPKPLQANRDNGLLGALGLGGAVPTKSLSPSPVKPANPNPNPNPSVSPPFAPSPNKPPLPNPGPDKGKEKTPPPINPTDNKPEDLSKKLAGLGAILALIGANTQFDNLKNAAKTGSCESLKSPSCTKDMEDRIKDPINQKVDSVATKVAAASSTIDLLKNVADNSFKFISRIYNNQFIHSSLSFMTTMTTIHNAAMLSRDVAETLGTVVDNSINLSGNKLKDTDGNDINFTSWVGTNIRAIIVQIIGADKYVQLALQWQKANTIYHSAMGVLNTTQSMIDPLSSAVEYGMENVSKIGNSLKEDGVVSENSYPAMDETIRARRVNRFERLNDTLEGAENIASNLSSVTSSAVSVKEDYKQLREDAKDFKDKAAAFNTADSEARAALKAELPTDITPITLAPAPAEDEEP